MLTLYFAPGSSSMAAHIALHEVGVPFESRAVSFKRKETRTPEFLAMNPRGKVPVLVVDGHVLTEVAGILFYLARRYPESGLLPAGDALAEGEVVSWMSFLASGVHPSRQAGMDVLREMHALADRRLGSGDWAVGDAYSIADIHLFRLYWRSRAQLDPGALPNLERHYQAVMARPAVRKTIEIESAVGYELPE
ncbi:MAG: glutathione S-transferase family protein [Acidimicrobiia bacterium]|nr:glutathione S-transferase family protein [Acidimicrobiia bacterium]